MITLALDTCLGACSVAVVDGDRTLADASEPMTRGHQERLAPMTREVMAAAGVAFSDLDRIGVTVGPGSFTGLRVGLAFAKGLALALDIPCLGVGALVALAAGVKTEGICVAVIDSGRGLVYRQTYQSGEAARDPDVVTVEDAAAQAAEALQRGAVTLVGPSEALLAAISGSAVQIVVAAPSAVVVAALAARAPISPPRPLYLRPPDAKPKAA